MAMSGIWNELGIAPTGDRKAVQRAYAQKLKAVKSDAEAFKRLRAAYEAAIAQIERAEWAVQEAAAEEGAAQPGDVAEDGAQREAPADMPPQDEPAADDPAAQSWAAFEGVLKAKDPLGAMAVFDSAQAQGFVPLGLRDQLVEKVMAVALEDRRLSPEAYLDLVKRAGWAPSVGRLYYWSPVLQKVLARAEAEEWYLHLKALAEAPRRKIANLRDPSAPPHWEEGDRYQVKNARLLMQKPRLLWALQEPRAAHLAQLLAEYRLHLPWIEARIPASRIEAIARLAQGSKWFRILWGGGLILLIAAIALGAILSGGHFAFFGAFILIRMIWELVRRFRARRAQ